MGSGLASMARTGQLERLFVHLGHYAALGEISYFSWGDQDEETALWRPFQAQTDARLVLVRGWGWSRAVRRCEVLRSMNLLGTIPALYARGWGRPFVMSYGADYPAIADIHGRPTWKWRALQSLAVPLAARVLVSNQALARRLRRRFPSARIVNHPNWVDTDRFRPLLRREPNAIFRVYYVGRLVREKNLLVAAEAVAGVGATFVCLGDGPLADELRRHGAELHGAIPWRDLPRHLNSADAFLLASLSEGHPKALMEAMACAVPCVVSTVVDGLPEGIAVRAEPESGRLAKALGAIMDDSLGAARMAQRARAWVQEHLAIERLIPKELAYVRGAVVRQRPR